MANTDSGITTRDLLLEMRSTMLRMDERIEELTSIAWERGEKHVELEVRVSNTERTVRAALGVLVTIITGFIGLAFYVIQNVLRQGLQ